MAEFTNVTAIAKANIYFDGKVVSHTIVFPDGSKKTLGLIYPGTFHFGTAKAEIMQIIDGSCKVILDGNESKLESIYKTGEEFQVPANSGFHITVEVGITQYICSFIE